MDKPDPIEEVSDGELEGIQKLKQIISKRQGEKIGTEFESTPSPYPDDKKPEDHIRGRDDSAIPTKGKQTSTKLFPDEETKAPIKLVKDPEKEVKESKTVPKTVENRKPKQNLLGRLSGLFSRKRPETVRTTQGVNPLGQKVNIRDSSRASRKRESGRPKKKDGFGYGDLNIANITADTVYDDETYVGRPEKPAKHETYIRSRQNKSYNMNKITKTRVGDDIHFYINGKEGRGIVSKMTNLFVTVFKSDGKFYEIPLNDTFFVKDILINKTWNEMDEYERTEILQKVHILSPMFLLKSWEQLPEELRDIIKSKTKIKSDVERGEYGGISTETEIDATDDYEGQTHEGTREEQFDYEEKKPEVLHKEGGAMSSNDSGVVNVVNAGKKEKVKTTKTMEFVYSEHSEYKTKKFETSPNFGITYMTKEEKEEFAKKEKNEAKKLGSATDVDTSLSL